MKKRKPQASGKVIPPQRKAPERSPLLLVNQDKDQIGFHITEAGAWFLAQFLAQGGGFGPTTDPAQVWLTDGVAACESPQAPPPAAQWRVPEGKRAQILEQHFGRSDTDAESISLMLGMLSLWLQNRLMSDILSGKDADAAEEDPLTDREARRVLAPLLELLSKDKG